MYTVFYIAPTCRRHYLAIFRETTPNFISNIQQYNRSQ